MNELKPPAVYAAIAAVSAEMATQGIEKNRTNKQQGFRYRGIDDVMNALSPLLPKHGLVILPRIVDRVMTERKAASGSPLFYTFVRVEFDFVAVADGSKHTAVFDGEAMDSGDKSTNKAHSVAYRTACIEVLCIPTEGDHDADATTHQPLARAEDKISDEQVQRIEGIIGEQKFDRGKVKAALTKAYPGVQYFRDMTRVQYEWLDKQLAAWIEKSTNERKV